MTETTKTFQKYSVFPQVQIALNTLVNWIFKKKKLVVSVISSNLRGSLCILP